MAEAADSEFDYIIVGAGSAGCVLANRLTADARIRVCLVEAGPSDRRLATRLKVNLPVGNTILLSSPKYNWGHSFAGNVADHRNGIPSPRGRVVGGSSAVNGMVYMRGHPSDYDHWSALGNPGWSWSEVLPAFKTQEHRERGADDFHGVGGELNVAPLRWLNPLTRAFVAAAAETQFPINDDFNGATQDGFGPHEVTQRNGQRFSSARAFLDPVLARPNLMVLHDSLTLRVTLDGRRATGVVVRTHGRERALTARREVILAGGAYNSPQLLLLSGIGPGDGIRAQGIAVAHELPGVGRNFHDHPTIWVQREDRSARSFALSARALPWLAKAVLTYALTRQGPLTSNLVEAGGFLRSRPDIAAPDLQFVFMPAIKDFVRWVPHRHGFGLCAVLLQPESRGRLDLASSDPAVRPRIEPRFLDNAADVERMVHGIRIARQILSAPAFAAAGGAEVNPGADVTSTTALADYLRKNLTTSFHPVGTCKMGPHDDAQAVVDHRLRVHGIEGLRVVDASIMPRIVSGNTNAPTMMIAERAAAFIRGDAR